MQDPVEPGAHEKRDVGVLQGQGARRRDRQRMLVRYHALAHRRAQEWDLLRSIKAHTLPSVRDQAMPLPTMTSGRDIAAMLAIL